MLTPTSPGVTLAVRAVAADDWRCPACEATAEMHQPDPALPGRLIAVCPSCGGWWLRIEASDGNHALAVELPGG